MGVLNVTPDSFSDGGRYTRVETALAHARQMLGQGAQIIDVGGESTRPGAPPVPEQEELDRVLPVIERLHTESGCIVSVDTMKPAVMRAACTAGAELINDVMALRAPGTLAAALDSGAGVCLMHMQNAPPTMQQSPCYDDVVQTVKLFLTERLENCIAAGIRREKIVIDPGFGFGKNLEHNLSLLGGLNAFASLGVPLLVGFSRKSMFQSLLNLPVEQRLIPSVIAAALAVFQGAAIVRAHDVRETVQALRLANAIMLSANERKGRK